MPRRAGKGPRHSVPCLVGLLRRTVPRRAAALGRHPLAGRHNREDEEAPCHAPRGPCAREAAAPTSPTRRPANEPTRPPRQGDRGDPRAPPGRRARKAEEALTADPEATALGIPCFMPRRQPWKAGGLDGPGGERRATVFMVAGTRERERSGGEEDKDGQQCLWMDRRSCGRTKRGKAMVPVVCCARD